MDKRYRILKTYAIVIDVNEDTEEEALKWADQKQLRMTFNCVDEKAPVVSIFWVKREDTEDQIEEI